MTRLFFPCDNREIVNLSTPCGEHLCINVYKRQYIKFPQLHVHSHDRTALVMHKLSTQSGKSYLFVKWLDKINLTGLFHLST